MSTEPPFDLFPAITSAPDPFIKVTIDSRLRGTYVVGVTGTDGKTTSSTMLWAAWRAAGLRAGLISTVDFRDGDNVVPNTTRQTTMEAVETHCRLAALRSFVNHENVAALDTNVRRVVGRLRFGPDAPAYHVEVGEAAAAVGIDALLAIGPLATGYLDGAAGRIASTRYAETLNEALAALQEFLEPGDAVLVKGARALGLEAVAETLAGAAA